MLGVFEKLKRMSFSSDKPGLIIIGLYWLRVEPHLIIVRCDYNALSATERTKLKGNIILFPVSQKFVQFTVLAL